MSISYEEALATLEAMFGAPWTRESLDLVLRHEKGHMENTCDRILSYGSENDPQGLLRQLQSGQGLSSSGGNVGGGDQQAAHNINMDEEIARQLAAQQGGAGGGAAASAGAPTTQQKGRGTPTVLPKDFLRIPGYPHRSVLLERASGAGRSGVSSGTSAMNGAEMDDETLARMLQDEFFSQELARNPEFAHLAGGRVPHRTGRSGATFPPGQRRSTTTSQSRQQQQALPQGPNIIDKLSEMGDTARKRLSLFATQFENQLNQTRQNFQKNRPGGGVHDAAAGMGGGAGMSAAERRGLLDDGDEEDMIEFEVRKNQ